MFTDEFRNKLVGGTVALLVGLLLGALSSVGDAIVAAVPKTVAVRILSDDTVVVAGRDVALWVELKARSRIPLVSNVSLPAGIVTLAAEDEELLTRSDSLRSVRVRSLERTVRLPTGENDVFLFSSERRADRKTRIIVTFTPDAGGARSSDTLEVYVGPASKTTRPNLEHLAGTWDLRIGEHSGVLVLNQESSKLSGDLQLGSEGIKGSAHGIYDASPHLEFEMDSMPDGTRWSVTMNGGQRFIHDNYISLCTLAVRRRTQSGAEAQVDSVSVELTARLERRGHQNSENLDRMHEVCGS